jgi:stage V sporulation protein B
MQSPPINTSEPEAPPADIARVAGRGTIYITAAKLWFMASGYGIHFTLPRLISPEQVGLYQIVISVVSIINAVVVTGTSQTVSKYISHDVSKADAVKAKALRLQLGVGGALALAFFLLAPVTANYLNDARLTPYLRLASLITFSYAFYAVYTGYFNGQKKFLTQAALDVIYSTLKLAFIVLLVWLGFGVMGGVGGFALAAGSVLLISALAARGGGRTGEVRAKDLLRFQAYLLLFTLVLNLLQKVDLILVKALSSADAIVASENVAYYGAAINIANIIYQVIISVTFIIFPLVSQATFANDRERTRVYIVNTMRYTLMIMALLATLFSANASSVLRVIYPDEYQAGSHALAVVAFGMLFFGLIYVMTTIISASGHPTISLALGLVTLTASAALNALLIPKYGLTGGAIGTTAAMIIGAVIGGSYLLKTFSALLPLGSFVRITGCSALIYAASIAFTPTSKPLIIAKLALLGVVYLLALVVSRELGRDDLAMVQKVFKKN